MKNKMFPKAKSVVRDLDPINDLRFLRMRSNKTEILIAPGKLGNNRICSQILSGLILNIADDDYILIVMQPPPAE